MDTFAFFDTGYRVLNGEHPFKDFWVVSGPFIDYLGNNLLHIWCKLEVIFDQFLFIKFISCCN